MGGDLALGGTSLSDAPGEAIETGSVHGNLREGLPSQSRSAQMEAGSTKRPGLRQASQQLVRGMSLNANEAQRLLDSAPREAFSQAVHEED